MNYAQIAVAVYQHCTHFDPYLPPVSADLARAWGTLFEKHRLNEHDLLAGVDLVYDQNGSGYRPLPADIIAAARSIRRDRAERESDAESDARRAANARRLMARVEVLAESKTVDQALKHAEDAVLTLCTACHKRPLVTDEDIDRGTCTHCAPHVSTQRPANNSVPERNNA